VGQARPPGLIGLNLKILLNGDSTLKPILGPSGTMSNGENPNDTGMDHVSDVIGKHFQIHTAIAIWPQVGQLRMILDLCCRRLDFEPEADTQS
jgi:hypothetical protein